MMDAVLLLRKMQAYEQSYKSHIQSGRQAVSLYSHTKAII